MFGGVKKEEYEEVVKANNKLRAEMEKLRLENALLKDQIRAFYTLPSDLSSLYAVVQYRMNATSEDIRDIDKFANLSLEEITEKLEKMVQMNLFEKSEKNGEIYYSIKTPDVSDMPPPKDNKVRV